MGSNTTNPKTLIDAADEFCRKGEAFVSALDRFKVTSDNPVPSEDFARARLHEIKQEGARGKLRTDYDGFAAMYANMERAADEVLASRTRLLAFIAWARRAWLCHELRGGCSHPYKVTDKNALMAFASGADEDDYAIDLIDYAREDND